MNIGSLKAHFSQLYPESGTPFVCRIPGRVNLMGEHLDYNGLPVLPMTIDRAVHLAFAPTAGSEVRLANVNEAYTPTAFVNGSEIAPSAVGAWDNYAKAALVGLNQRFKPETHPGMDVLITSDLPNAAGLSSSSALVVGFGMAYLAALGYTLGQDISLLEFAAVMAEAEHFVGTAGGGMDQTAILHGEEGCATRVNFIPFQVETVPLPEGVCVVVCDSLVEAAKTGEALKKYNAGPATCGLITALIDQHLKETFGEEFAIECLGDLWLGPLCFNRKEVGSLLEEIFPTPMVQVSEIAEKLQLSDAEMKAQWLDHIPHTGNELPLQARMRHILTEYYRVEEGRDALIAGDAVGFGKLMDESHASCAGDYAISTPELDALCIALRDAGCYGARLTGAGFGGSVVALAPLGEADAILKAVHESYYGTPGTSNGQCPAFYTTGGMGARHIS